MKGKPGVALVGLLGIALAGCTGQTIRDLNGDLLQYQTARSEAARTLLDPKLPEKQAIDAKVRQATAESALANLMGEAHKAAKEAKDGAVAISLYRVAVTAAWQAQRPETLAQVRDISNEGKNLCDRNEGEFRLRRTPRDCAMLAVIPPLAASDENIPAARALQQEHLADRAANRLPQTHPSRGPRLEKLFSAFMGSVADIDTLKSGSAVPAGILDPAFIIALEARRGTIGCNARLMADYFVEKAPSTSENASAGKRMFDQLGTRGIGDKCRADTIQE